VVNETVTDSTETRQLLARPQAGEAEAFEQLCAQHRAYLHQVIEMRLDAQTRRRVGDEEEARRWYERAVEWMDSNQPHHRGLLRFPAEAAELLGMELEPPAGDEGKEAPPEQK